MAAEKKPVKQDEKSQASKDSATEDAKASPSDTLKVVDKKSGP